MILGFLLAAGAPTSLLLDTGQLADLDGALPVDTRSAEDFAEGHIPGAAHLDAISLSEKRDGVPNMLKSMNTLFVLFGESGLDPGRSIVVYSGLEDGGDIVRATRLFWALDNAGFPNVRLLDGGLNKWKGEGRGLEHGPSTVEPVDQKVYIQLKPAAGNYATLEGVQALQNGKSGIIVDLRGEPLFTGASKMSIVAREGHISGAECHPASSFLDGPYFTFKSPAAIRQLVAAEKTGADVPIITYCNTGHSATVGYVAYRLAGFKDVAVYDGSMAEWGNRAECPVSTGPEQ